MSGDLQGSLKNDSRPNNAVLLTRGIEKILRRLVGFLVGKISLVKLQEMIRFIYVEETERKLRVENPGRDIPLTQLALLTGLDTRTLAKTRNDERYRQPPDVSRRRSGPASGQPAHSLSHRAGGALRALRDGADVPEVPAASAAPALPAGAVGERSPAIAVRSSATR